MTPQPSQSPVPGPASAKPPARLRAALANGGLVLASLLVGALLLEGALRLWSPGHLKLFPRYHEAVAYGDYTLRRTRPGTEFVHTSVDGSWRFRVNPQGFRDDEPYAHERRPGLARVLLLGDSQAFGYEADAAEILPARLEAHLAARGIRAEVLNTGVSGFGTAEQLVFLEQEGLRYRPDLVVLMFFKNDYSDSVRSGLFASRDGALVETGRAYAPGTGILRAVNAVALLRWLSERSYLYSLVFNGVWNAAKTFSIARADADPFERTSGIGEVPAHQRDLARLLLARMSRTLADRGVPLAVVDVPDVTPSGDVRDFEPSLGPEEAGRLRALGAAVIEAEAVLGPHRRARSFHRPHGDRHVTGFVHDALAGALAEVVAPLLAGAAKGP